MKRFFNLVAFLLAMSWGSVCLAQAPPPATFVAVYNATGQTGNIASTPLSPQINPVIYALGGEYKVTCYVILTTAGSVSSTLPACNVIFTDEDTGNSHTVAFTSTSTANTVDTIGAPAANTPGIHVKPSTTISFSTSSYAASSAASMQYAIHIYLEYVGP